MKLSFLITGLFLFNLTNAQNVGIGTTTPSQKLDVRGSTTDDGVQISVGNADGSHKLGLFGGRLNDPNPFILWKDGDPLRFATDLSGFNELMRIMPNGNIGIGTATPTLAKLHVQGMVGNIVAMFRGSSTSQGISFADDWPGIYFNSYWNDGLKSMSATGYPSFINSEQSNGDISFNLSNIANTAANSLVTAPERMRITSTGQLGIGTATPAASAILDVSSTSKGFLPPRMTITQRNAITNPEVGLVIFCTDCDELQFYNGSLWKNLGGTLACQISGPPSITICNQVWALKNLDVTRYRNGDLIPQVTDVAQWASLTTGAWCWYNNDSSTYASTYGKLYNWYAVNDPRGLAPQGWHISSDPEWSSTLSNCLGGSTIAGGKMKEMGTSHWLSPNTGANNSSGFTGLPGGSRNDAGSFSNINSNGYWWSSWESSVPNAYARFLRYDGGEINPGVLNKRYGLSVRCLRD